MNETSEKPWDVRDVVVFDAQPYTRRVQRGIILRVCEGYAIVATEHSTWGVPFAQLRRPER